MWSNALTYCPGKAERSSPGLFHGEGSGKRNTGNVTKMLADASLLVKDSDVQREGDVTGGKFALVCAA